MALVLILQLLTFWPLCHTDITRTVPPASYPKPQLGAQPAAIVTPGVNVTLRCRAPQPAWRFALFKSGEIDPVLYRDVSVELAEFFLEEVTPAQGGSYRCCYRNPGWAPGVWSHPSDALELLVTGSGSSDYTLGNLIRLGLAGLILVSLATLVVLDWRTGSRAPRWRLSPSSRGLDLDACSAVRRLSREAKKQQGPRGGLALPGAPQPFCPSE